MINRNETPPISTKCRIMAINPRAINSVDLLQSKFIRVDNSKSYPLIFERLKNNHVITLHEL